MESRNIRHLDPAELPCKPQMATIDVSFISLQLVLPVLADILDEGKDLVALIKPQFEAGKGKVGKKGIVRDPDIHREVIEEILEVATGVGFKLRELAPSPLKGADGNIEFFAWWVRGEPEGEKEMGTEVEKVVKEAWDER
jgi:23S rRNA (cytidine1920-2'-O)/16S rRNA (cytidine1409-2'-O)-methyltransferase